MTFGEKITYARKQKKMTQGDLGKAVGTSGDIIGKYEICEVSCAKSCKMSTHI